jgi:hypothetical protein
MDTSDLLQSDLLQSYVSNAISQANMLYNLCAADKLNSVNPIDPYSYISPSVITFLKGKHHTPLSKFKKLTIPIDAVIGSDCKCDIDIYKICTSFDAHFVGNIDVMFFDDAVMIDEIVLMNGDIVHDKCNHDLLHVYDYLEISKMVKEDGKLIINLPFFFKYPEFPLLKSNSKLSIKVNYKFANTKVKFFVDIYAVQSLFDALSLKSVVQTIGMNYFCSTILENKLNDVHTFDLNFEGSISSFVILLKPFNPNAFVEFDGAIYQKDNLVTLFSPVLNEITVAEKFKVEKYNKNIYISSFSLSPMLGATMILGSYNITDDPLTIKFKINPLSHDTGSVFVQIWAPKYESLQMPLNDLVHDQYNKRHDFPLEKNIFRKPQWKPYL